MAKTKRLIELIMTVNAKRKFTVKELAEEFGVSKRTILRDLQELSALGIPLYSEVGPHGGYRVLKNRMLPPIAFTENEAIALFFASQSLEFYSSLPFETESASALKKFYHYLPDDTRRKIDKMRDRVLFWTPFRSVKSPHLRDLLEAAVNREMLTVQYDSASGLTSRDLLPLGLYASNGYWYCPAYCNLRREIRLFRADRMLDVSKKEEAIPMEDFEDRKIRDLVHDDSPPEQTMTVHVELTRIGLRKFQTESRNENEITVLDDGSGTVMMTMNRRDMDFFTDFFLSLGTDAKVLSPTIMVARIREKIEELSRHYR